MVSQSAVPVPRKVAFSAFRAGSLRSLVVRRSGHSCSGFVLVASFGCAGRAGSFARQWARRLGLSVIVRRSGSFWLVSVPVVVASPGVFAGVAARVGFVGGLQRLVQFLGHSPVWSGVASG